MHLSVPKDAQCEFINLENTPNPLISKCQIKVCYVSDKPNRNRSIITKEVARNELAPSLRGCPIVGVFNESNEDYEEHNKTIKISDGKFTITEDTKPYGFVDINARIWFQKFIDDNHIEREYLVTEGYIWTGAYPESQRIIERGNNQSMELDGATMEGQWERDANGEPQFFIINKAIISKLCILGEDFEPCFEGAQIKASFSLDEGFKETLFSMVNEVKKIFGEGGNPMDSEKDKKPAEEFSQIEDPTPAKEFIDQPKEEKPESAQDFKVEDKEEKKPEPKEEEEKKEEEPEKKEEEPKEEESQKKEYSLDEIPEYVELNNKFSQLTTDFSTLAEEVKELREFKAKAEKAEKQKMIDQFYMLSDEDKADVVSHIDTYSLEEIESKLSVICVRNRVDFSLDKKEEEPADKLTYSLVEEADDVPEWIKAVKETEKNL